MNPRINNKERNLIKGAIRRVFVRSDMRKMIFFNSLIEHKDPKKPRVKKWSVCQLCKKIVPAYKTQVDHISPVVPIGRTLENMTWDEIVNNIWCSIDNLQLLCYSCHSEKSSIERKERRKLKNERKT